MSYKHSIRFVLIAAVYLSLFSTNSHASYRQALKTYQSGDFAQAKTHFEALAAIGNRASLFNLGVMYARGEAVEEDLVKAYVLVKIANTDIEDDKKNYNDTESQLLELLNEQQKSEAERLFLELDPIYNIKQVRKQTQPRPVSDENSAIVVIPIKRKKPQYPAEEGMYGNMGLTYLEYTISPQGYPRDVVVTSSTSRAFSKATLSAIKGFLYKPMYNGKPVFSHPQVFVFTFNDNPYINTRSLTLELKQLREAAKQGNAVAQFKYAKQLSAYRHFRKLLKDVDLRFQYANAWYGMSAYQGLANAQYEFGRNIMRGTGCEVDEENGRKWVHAAALSGFSPAQHFMAQDALANNDGSRAGTIAAMRWLRSAASDDSGAASVLLAWELATSPFEDLRNGEEALKIIAKKPRNYFDDVRLLETKAAAYAELGDFKKAKKFQRKAEKKAAKLNWDIPLIAERMSLYDREEAYRGAYY